VILTLLQGTNFFLNVEKSWFNSYIFGRPYAYLPILYQYLNTRGSQANALMSSLTVYALHHGIVKIDLEEEEEMNGT
jgi:hypothetical protein